MANRPLTRLGVDESVTTALQTSLGVTTAADLLNCSPLELMVCADLSLAQANTLTKSISTRIAPKVQTANQFFQKRLTEKRFLSTGFEFLDRVMKGGILLGSVTDICGTPGVGKTQFCASTVAFTSGVDESSVIYIDAELKLDVNRIQEIALEAMPETYNPTLNNTAMHNLDQLLNRIKIHRPITTKDLETLIQTTIENEIVANNVKLVVIDSIAALIRKDNLDEKDRDIFVMTIATKLKQLSEKCHCAILATNQVQTASTSLIGSEVLGERIVDSSGIYVPALGPTWHHCVTTRLVIHRQPIPIANTFGTGGRSIERRYIRVVKSPLVPPHPLPFVITSRGLELFVEEQTSDSQSNSQM